MKLVQDEIAALYRRVLRGEVTLEEYARTPARNGVIIEGH